MKIGGVIKVNNALVGVAGVLLLMVVFRYVCDTTNMLENLANEEPLYYDPKTFRPHVYDTKKLDGETTSSENTADYYRNLNPYEDRLLPKDSLFAPDSSPAPLSPPAPSNKKEGVTADQIPLGQEKLYVLKSSIVPPVCPRCPSVDLSKLKDLGKAKCPPCPACARCPEQPFTCKKVPNYKAMNSDNLPGGFLPRMS